MFLVTKEKPLSYMHTVPFGHSNVFMLLWEAEKCHFVLSSVGEDALSQQSSECCSTSPSPEEHSGLGVLFPCKSCFWMGAGAVLAGEQQGTWQGGGWGGGPGSQAEKGSRRSLWLSQGTEPKQCPSAGKPGPEARGGWRLFPTALKIHVMPQPCFLVLPVSSPRGNLFSISSPPGPVPRPSSCFPPSAAHPSAAPQGQATFPWWEMYSPGP